MFGIVHFEAYAIAAFILIIIPGNDTIFILSRSIAQGKKAGIISSLGVGTGSSIHTTLAAFGLSVIIAKSILVFTIIKYAGAAYLMYVGIKMIFFRSAPDFTDGKNGSAWKMNSFQIYKQAVLTDVLNPKVAMFFIAFLPQFIDSGYKNSFIPFAILGFLFSITGTLWSVALAIFSSGIFTRLRNNNKISEYMNKACGSVLLLLGIRLALEKKT